jgi:hypothetical protein
MKKKGKANESLPLTGGMMKFVLNIECKNFNCKYWNNLKNNFLIKIYLNFKKNTKKINLKKFTSRLPATLLELHNENNK